MEEVSNQHESSIPQGLLSWILVIDSDSSACQSLKSKLEVKGYDVVTAEDGEQALIQVKRLGEMPSAVIMEMELPGKAEFELLDHFRKESFVPILLLSTIEDEGKKVEAFERGADDYVTKPYRVEEVCARIGAIIRRSGRLGGTHALEPTMTFGCLTVNFFLREIRVRDKFIKVTPIEYDLLKYMIEHAGQVLTHRMLLTAVWGQDYVDKVEYLRVYMGQLRKKLEKESSGQTFIHTDSKIGYRFIGEKRQPTLMEPVEF